MAAAALLLAACGSSSTSSSSSTGGSASASGGSGSASALLKLACVSGSNLGAGEQIPVGVNVALSGQGAYYGDVMTSAAKLAAGQIKAAGGPDFQIVAKDNQSGVAAAGVQTTRELGQAGVHLAEYSFIGDLGSAFPGIAQYKILSLDGGGGTQKFGQRKPFFYGTRSQPPNDSFAGIALYMKAKFPNVKRVSFIIGDTGAQNVKDSTAILTAALKNIGVSIVDTEVVTYGGTDFSTAVTKIIAANTDMVIEAQYGTDTGYFLKQYRGAGGKLPVFGVDIIPAALKIAGPQASVGYLSAQQYFNPGNPGNAWGEYFVKTWKAAYPGKGAPDFYAADYYQDMFTLWQTVIRTKAAGGNVSSGDDLLKAFTSSLTFPSVAGTPQPGQSCATYSMDPTTHTVTSTTMGIGEVQPDGATVKQVASFNIGGADFKLLG